MDYNLNLAERQLVEMWDQKPNDEEVKERIYDFFDKLPEDINAAFDLVQIEPHQGKTIEDTREALLRSLWEDLEDWWEELDDPSFTGSWLSHLTPLRQVQTDTLGWDVVGSPGEQTAIVNVHCYDGEPTDDTAQFSVRETPQGYALFIDQIHVM